MYQYVYRVFSFGVLPLEASPSPNVAYLSPAAPITGLFDQVPDVKAPVKKVNMHCEISQVCSGGQ